MRWLSWWREPERAGGVGCLDDEPVRCCGEALEAVMFVERGGGLVDGVDDDEPSAGGGDGCHGPGQGIDQQLGAEALSV